MAPAPPGDGGGILRHAPPWQPLPQWSMVVPVVAAAVGSEGRRQEWCVMVGAAHSRQYPKQGERRAGKQQGIVDGGPQQTTVRTRYRSAGVQLSTQPAARIAAAPTAIAKEAAALVRIEAAPSAPVPAHRILLRCARAWAWAWPAFRAWTRLWRWLGFRALLRLGLGAWTGFGARARLGAGDWLGRW